jgi:hypothetical protein
LRLAHPALAKSVHFLAEHDRQANRIFRARGQPRALANRKREKCEQGFLIGIRSTQITATALRDIVSKEKERELFQPARSFGKIALAYRNFRSAKTKWRRVDQ